MTTSIGSWPLRRSWLKLCVGKASGIFDVAHGPCVVAAVLADPQWRLAVAGARETMPFSLGSVYAGSVTRFLGGDARKTEHRVHLDAAQHIVCAALNADASVLAIVCLSPGIQCELAWHDLASGCVFRKRLVTGWRRACINVAPDGTAFVAVRGADDEADADGDDDAFFVYTPLMQFKTLCRTRSIGLVKDVLAVDNATFVTLTNGQITTYRRDLKMVALFHLKFHLGIGYLPHDDCRLAALGGRAHAIACVADRLFVVDVANQETIRRLTMKTHACLLLNTMCAAAYSVSGELVILFEGVRMPGKPPTHHLATFSDDDVQEMAAYCAPEAVMAASVSQKLAMVSHGGAVDVYQ